jgi:amidohydrolase
MTINDKILEKLDKYYQEALNVKNYLHQNPELSSREYETSKFLKEECKRLGLVVEEVNDSTGFTALLDTGRAGKTLGIRTDIDALPIMEDRANLKREKEFVSKNDGVMHACGHDVHMTTALFSGKILNDLKDNFSGKIYFIFEEAEETGMGIEKMVNHLKDKNIDAFYGNHVDVNIPVGKTSVRRGPVFAGAAGFDFDVIGSGGHGSRPDLCVSPIMASVAIINTLQTIRTNRIDQAKPITLSIGSINGGFASNVIPDTCNVKGTIRFLDPEAGIEAFEILQDIVEKEAAVHGCSVVFNPYTRLVAEPTINDDKLTDLAEKAFEELFEDPIQVDEITFGSETFSYYRHLAPVFFNRVGVANEEYGSGAKLHTPKFDADPKSVYYAISFATKFAIAYLSEDWDDEK